MAISQGKKDLMKKYFTEYIKQPQFSSKILNKVFENDTIANWLFNTMKEDILANSEAILNNISSKITAMNDEFNIE